MPVSKSDVYAPLALNHVREVSVLISINADGSRSYRTIAHLVAKPEEGNAGFADEPIRHEAPTAPAAVAQIEALIAGLVIPAAAAEFGFRVAP